MNYYNEHDPRAAAWLRELIKAKLITQGDVDERDIQQVTPPDLRGYTQCHFFAGIGGWPLALQLAGWPESRPVWTGSCPCQPFSCAGQGKGESDERHLWPEFKRLIEACQPATIFGEQVASKLGREWLAGVFADLEGMAYQRAGADLCAAGVGAPHIRQRLFWVAKSGSQPAGRLVFGPGQGAGAIGERTPDQPGGSSRARGLADSASAGPLPGAHAGIHRGEEGAGPRNGEPERRGATGRLGEPIQPGLEGHAGHGDDGRESGRLDPAAHRPIAETGAVSGGVGDASIHGCEVRPHLHGEVRGEGSGQGREHGAWSRFDLIPCADGKARRVESGTFPLAHGIPGRVGLLRGYGNAIVPQVAAQFIIAYLEATGDQTNV